MSLPAEDPPEPGPSVPISTPLALSSSNGVGVSDNSDIVSWAIRSFPDTFPALPSHEELQFKSIGGSEIYDPDTGETEETENTFKIIYVGTYNPEEKNNGNVHAYIDPHSSGHVLYIREKEYEPVYDRIRHSDEPQISFESPFTDLVRKKGYHSEIGPLLDALIHYYLFASRNILWMDSGEEKDWQKLYPGFGEKFEKACKCISDNTRAQNPETVSPPVGPVPDISLNHSGHPVQTDLSSTSINAFHAGQSNRRTRRERKAGKRINYRESHSSLDELEDDTDTDEDIESSDGCVGSSNLGAQEAESARRERPRKRNRTQRYSDSDDDKAEIRRFTNQFKAGMKHMTRFHAKHEEKVMGLKSRIVDLESQLTQVKGLKDRDSSLCAEISSLRNEIDKLRGVAKEAEMRATEAEEKSRHAELELAEAKMRSEPEQKKRIMAERERDEMKEKRIKAEKERDEMQEKWNNMMAAMGLSRS
ncbi:hypothetical protein DM02DRAFT_691196 [Periconia macrospinosa]|uniref:Uncharacterized protein n=1 Tax=Periconia macrospinosa TaxID=97972 RepID=A0A2V1DAW3_9PLEO|nr:hypothetical protein DM02DRAFT_691196 [Periconia macrospinosa]